jgi:hypothetical protein
MISKTCSTLKPWALLFVHKMVDCENFVTNYFHSLITN